MVTTCRPYACPLPLHAATDLHLWGATALTQKSPRLNVRAFITSEIIHSNDAQCNTIGTTLINLRFKLWMKILKRDQLE